MKGPTMQKQLDVACGSGTNHAVNNSDVWKNEIKFEMIFRP